MLLLHVLGVGLYLAFAAGRPAFAGAGLLAYTLGLRHAFDADHIAAIDNTVRKLRGDGRCALGVGFFFSLGHSTVVLALACGLALAAGAVRGAIDPIHTMAATSARPSRAASWVGDRDRQPARARRPRRDDAADLAARGRRARSRARRRRPGRSPARLLARPLALIRSAWQMYPLGILFGLGFDTATEIGLLALSATAAGAHAPALAIVSLPAAVLPPRCRLRRHRRQRRDGSAYGWGLAQTGAADLLQPRRDHRLLGRRGADRRRRRAMQVAASALGLEGALWRWLDGLDFQLLGYAIVAALPADMGARRRRLALRRDRAALGRSLRELAPPAASL